MQQFVDLDEEIRPSVTLHLPVEEVKPLANRQRTLKRLLKYEQHIDTYLQAKRVEYDEILRASPKVKRKLRIVVSSEFYPQGFPPTFNSDDQALVPPGIPAWELKVEGRLVPIETLPCQKVNAYKFSSFFKSLVIELDKDLYGPDNSIVEWTRTPNTPETDGFQVRRPGDQNVKCSIIMVLQHQTCQYRLDIRLARLLGFSSENTQHSRSSVIRALWAFIERNKLQDQQEPDIIRPNHYLGQLLECPPNQTLRFVDLPARIQRLLYPTDPIVLSYVVQAGHNTGNAPLSLQPSQPGTLTPATTDVYHLPNNVRKHVQCFLVDVEVDDAVKEQSIISLERFGLIDKEIQLVNSSINNLMDQIAEHNERRKFFKLLSHDPVQFLDRWLASQCRDLKYLSSDPVAWDNLEAHQRASAYFTEKEPWLREAIGRYIQCKLDIRKSQLERVIADAKTEKPGQHK